MATRKDKQAKKPRGNAAANNSSKAGKRSERQLGTATRTASPKTPEINVKESKDLVVVTIKFHGDKNGGHNHVIVDNIGDNHVSVGVSTKSKKGKNHPNYPLEQSSLGDGKKSYMRRQGMVAPKKEYMSPRKGKMTEKDYAQAKVYADRAKEKYKKEQEKKQRRAKHFKSISQTVAVATTY